MSLPFRPFAYLKERLPKGLFIRALIIVIAPMVLLQAAVSWTFFERHWQLVTRKLSSSVASEIAFLIAAADRTDVNNVLVFHAEAEKHLGFEVEFYPGAKLPTTRPQSFLPILDATIERELDLYLQRPVWFDTVTRHPLVDIRVQLNDGVVQVLVRRSRVYATNWHIFLVWMVVTSSALIAVAALFLRGQMRPIMRLAYAADAFGKGRDVPQFKPAGAREVRMAAQAFIDMRDRLRRYIEQRTEMLAGVSHDLRTPLTRMKLQLAMMKDQPAVRELKTDLDEMERMLEEFLDFARGESGEEPQLTNLRELIDEVCEGARLKRNAITVHNNEDLTLRVRRQAVKRAIANLVDNALNYAGSATVSGRRANGTIEVTVDDDGPGIPAELYEDAFRPFKRLDESRNPNTGGVGLGLSIARDVARAHGGDIVLDRAPQGGLRARLVLPT